MFESSQSKERGLSALSTYPHKQGTPSGLSLIVYGSVATING